MEVINEQNKQRLIEYIELNDLDYIPVDNGLTRFHILSEDKVTFTIYNSESQFLVSKYDGKKDNGRPGEQPFEYYQFKTFSEVLEQLKFYDDNLYKVYWQPTLESIEIGFDKNNHIEDWYSKYIKDEFYAVEETLNYKYIVYENKNYSPELISPFNTLHEVSDFNSMELTKVDRLYFEIHPVSCAKKNESYYVKVQCNNEEVLKDYINYFVYKEKGLKMFIEGLFNDMSKFKMRK
jgi:hypothetical protein